MRNLGTLGGDSSMAWGINDSGQVVGTAATADREYHAFLWEDGRMTDLGALGTGKSIAYALNRHGQVVGESTTAAVAPLGGPGNRAVGWEGGRIAALADASGPDGAAYGVTDRGEIVGEAYGGGGAVLWRGGEAVALADLLPAGHGWDRLVIARAVNERGQIVGWGVRGGARRAFLASPPALRATPVPGAPSATPVAAANLGVAEGVARARHAIREAGSYRYRAFPSGGQGASPRRSGRSRSGSASRPRRQERLVRPGRRRRRRIPSRPSPERFCNTL
jgi:probable HAF family extracellular repeat protein